MLPQLATSDTHARVFHVFDLNKSEHEISLHVCSGLSLVECRGSARKTLVERVRRLAQRLHLNEALLSSRLMLHLHAQNLT